MRAPAFTAVRVNGRDVDLSLGTVKSGKDPAVVLRPQTLAVLQLLAAKPGELVSKDALINAVWPDIAVTDDSLVQCIIEIRKALADEAHQIVKTVSRRGYVFEPGAPAKLPTKSVWSLAAAGLAALIALAVYFWFANSAPEPGRLPSIAVLPFDDMSAEKTLGYMADGVAEDIITMLARSPDVIVVSRNSSFSYKGKSLDIRQIGSELGADYVLEGSVRKDRGGLRIVAQLVDARSGEQVWAERFDKSGSDPWALQDEVTGQTIGALTGEYGQLKRAEYRKIWGKDATALGEYEVYLRGHEQMMKWTPESNEEARRIYTEGLAKFPDSALLRFKLGFYHSMQVMNGWSTNPAEDVRLANNFGREGFTSASLTPLEKRLGHWLLASTLPMAGNFDEADRHAETAIRLAPYDAFMIGDLATWAIWSGKTGRAIELSDFAIARDPANRGYYLMNKGWAQIAAEDYERGCTTIRDALDVFITTPLLRAICEVRHDRPEEAQREVNNALKLEPKFTAAHWRDITFARDPAVLDRQVADLVKAGLPAQ